MPASTHLVCVSGMEVAQVCDAFLDGFRTEAAYAAELRRALKQGACRTRRRVDWVSVSVTSSLERVPMPAQETRAPR